MPSKVLSHPARRGSRADDPFRKPGWQVRTSVADAVREAVEEGAAPSQNAFVERAILRHLAELRRDRLFESYEEAAQDPAFLADLQEISDAFEPAVADGLED